ncbi:hypothetical protein ACX8XP_08560 [Calditrichota bacterium LG25]
MAKLKYRGDEMIIARRFNGGKTETQRHLIVRPETRGETVSTVYANEQRDTILRKLPRSFHSECLFHMP